MHTTPHQTPLPSVLVIAGFDPSGGAGFLADTKTIHANGGYACSIMTAITVQNTQGVQAVEAIESKLFAAQLQALSEDIQFDAIKIGMLASLEQVTILSEFLQQTPKTPVVLDPVLVSSSGRALLPENALNSLIEDLIPQATLLTPNQPEAKLLLQKIHRPVKKNLLNDATAFQQALQGLKCKNILLKGGHPDITPDKSSEATDWLFSWEANQPIQETFSSPWLEVIHNHGTGCTLASAIATQLAKGENLATAVALGKNYLTQALQAADQHQPNYHSLPAGKVRHGSLCHNFKQHKHEESLEQTKARLYFRFTNNGAEQ